MRYSKIKEKYRFQVRNYESFLAPNIANVSTPRNTIRSSLIIKVKHNTIRGAYIEEKFHLNSFYLLKLHEWNKSFKKGSLIVAIIFIRYFSLLENKKSFDSCYCSNLIFLWSRKEYKYFINISLHYMEFQIRVCSYLRWNRLSKFIIYFRNVYKHFLEIHCIKSTLQLVKI